MFASAQISSSRCQSALFLARRETSSPITIPARPSPTSVTSCRKPSLHAADAPDSPWSESITTIRSSVQPSASARPRSAYCRFVLSTFSITCFIDDCRMYRYAPRSRWCDWTLSDSFMASPARVKLIAIAAKRWTTAWCSCSARRATAQSASLARKGVLGVIAA